MPLNVHWNCTKLQLTTKICVQSLWEAAILHQTKMVFQSLGSKLGVSVTSDWRVPARSETTWLPPKSLWGMGWYNVLPSQPDKPRQRQRTVSILWKLLRITKKFCLHWDDTKNQLDVTYLLFLCPPATSYHFTIVLRNERLLNRQAL